MFRIAQILAETLTGHRSAVDGDYGDQVMSAGWNPALEQLRSATDDPESAAAEARAAAPPPATR